MKYLLLFLLILFLPIVEAHGSEAFHNTENITTESSIPDVEENSLKIVFTSAIFLIGLLIIPFIYNEFTRKNKFDKKFLYKVIVISLFLASIATSWDIWWHRAIGRDTFWELPHLLLYSATSFTILAGVVGWWKTKLPEWKWLAIVLLIIPLAAPFDNIWHLIFGVENLDSIWVVWSPPHLMGIFSLLAASLLVANIVRKDSHEYNRLVFGSMIFSMILGSVTFILLPTWPYTNFALLGVYGIFFYTMGFVSVLLFSEKFMKVPGIIMLTGFLFIVSRSLLFNQNIATWVIARADVTPHWVQFFTVLIPAMYLSSIRHLSYPIRGSLAGISLGVVLFLLGQPFLNPLLVYTLTERLVGVILSGLGGLVGGYLIEKLCKNN